MPLVEEIKQHILELDSEDIANIGGYIEGILEMQYVLDNLEAELKEATDRVEQLQLRGKVKSAGK